MSVETRVRDILEGKSEQLVHTVGADSTVFEALTEMAVKNVGALLVREGERIIGLVSERDYARKIVLLNKSSRIVKVREIMESRVMYVVPEDTAKGCMSLMTEYRIRHLPVFSAGRLIGLVSMGDVVKAVISDREFLIAQLTRYVNNDLADSHTPFHKESGSIEPRVLAN